jgi:exodeoxyribonuclease VII large subunit
MFKRAAGGLDFLPRDGQQVDVSGRVGVYQPRGELQLVVERMVRAGEGTLFEQFLLLKARLEALGLFEAQRKRPLPSQVRGIGLVTSLGAAALHDVVTALKRRVPHIPVVLVPASVQGAGAATEICQALQRLYDMATARPGPNILAIDLILLVRGGGAMEDLWAFNDETLAHTLVRAPVPIVAGIGHETDFTIADFVSDLRAPTPTAAAEMCARSRDGLVDAAAQMQKRMQAAATRILDTQAQRLDMAAVRLGRPTAPVAKMRMALATAQQRMAHRVAQVIQSRQSGLLRVQTSLGTAARRDLQRQSHRVSTLNLRLGLLDPQLVLGRGYTWLADEQGHTLCRVGHLHPGQGVQARLVDGTVALQVQGGQPN